MSACDPATAPAESIPKALYHRWLPRHPASVHLERLYRVGCGACCGVAFCNLYAQIRVRRELARLELNCAELLLTLYCAAGQRHRFELADPHSLPALERLLEQYRMLTPE